MQTESRKFMLLFSPNILPSRLFSKNLNIKIYKIIILPVVLCGCKTWSLILRFENTTLGQVFGPKRDDNGEWRRLHNEEIHNLYRSPNIVRVIKSKRLRQTKQIPRMEECTTAFQNFNLQERYLQEGLDVCGWTMLETVLKKQMAIREIALIRSGERLLDSPCEYRFKPQGSITHGVNYLVLPPLQSIGL